MVEETAADANPGSFFFEVLSLIFMEAFQTAIYKVLSTFAQIVIKTRFLNRRELGGELTCSTIKFAAQNMWQFLFFVIIMFTKVLTQTSLVRSVITLLLLIGVWFQWWHYHPQVPHPFKSSVLIVLMTTFVDNIIPNNVLEVTTCSNKLNLYISQNIHLHFLKVLHQTSSFTNLLTLWQFLLKLCGWL